MSIDPREVINLEGCTGGVELSRDVATKLMEAFGPCSVLYETMSVDDLLEEVKGAKSLAAFCKLYLSVEDVEGEKAINAAYHEESSGEERYKGRHQQAVASRSSFEQEMKKRVVDFLKSQGESLEA